MQVVRDRRNEAKGRFKSSRQRFIDRNAPKIREAIYKKIGKGHIEDIGKGGADVSIPSDGIKQPRIRHGKGGVHERVIPGNKEYEAGKRIPRPPEGEGKGSGDGKASKEGDGAQDDFVFHITEDEFLNFVFEDLMLPNLVKEAGKDMQDVSYERAGYMNEGGPSKRDLVRSSGNRISRVSVTSKNFDRKILAELRLQYDVARSYDPDYKMSDLQLDDAFDAQRLHDKIIALGDAIDTIKQQTTQTLSTSDVAFFESSDQKLIKLARKKGLIPKWNESVDMEYRRHEEKPKPKNQAAMFCVMDVSGSMTEERKANAKLFYWLLSKFLNRKYEKVDIIFIRHTEVADEVDEETFFTDTKTGGTVVSSALEKMNEVLEERYPLEDWNIYTAQASDGDNWQDDTRYCVELLKTMLPKVQGYFYTETKERNGSDLWSDYKKVMAEFSDRFFMGRIRKKDDIWPIFREFFSNQETYETGPQRSAAFAQFAPSNQQV